MGGLSFFVILSAAKDLSAAGRSVGTAPCG